MWRKMCKDKNDFKSKAKEYKGNVENDEIDELFNKIGKDSVQELSRVIALQTEDANNDNKSSSRRLISFIKAELLDRKIKHSRWSTWIVAAATIAIAIST